MKRSQVFVVAAALFTANFAGVTKLYNFPYMTSISLVASVPALHLEIPQEIPGLL